MAFYLVGGNSNVQIDDSAGTLRDLSADILRVGDVGEQRAVVDVTSIADSAERFIMGLKESQEFDLEFLYDDAANKSDPVLAGLANNNGTLRTFQYGPIGTASGARKITMEVYVPSVKWQVGGPGDSVKIVSTFKLDGSATIGTF